jgi:BASS family bile acid:Na+ symporter
MFLLSDSQRLLVFGFLVAAMLSIGLRTGIADLRALLASRSFLIRALVANIVVVPLVGFALARLVPLHPQAAAALVVLACVPGGLAAVKYSSKVKGEEALAGAMIVLLSVLAIFVSPVILRIFLPAGVDLSVPYGRLLGFVALWILVPLVIGVFLNGKMPPRAAAGLARGLGVVSFVLFIAFMVVMKSFRKEATASIGGLAVGTMLLFIVLTMAIGWLMGGPKRGTRRLLATVTSMRNVAVCLAIARNSPGGDAVMTPLVAFSMLMVPPNTLLALYGAIADRRAARRAGGSKKGGDA